MLGLKFGHLELLKAVVFLEFVYLDLVVNIVHDRLLTNGDLRLVL